MKFQKILAIAAFAFVGALTANSAHAADSDWTTNYNAALVKAKSEHKLILLDFTGSDWCPPCIQLEKDVYEKAEFLHYAHKNLVLVKVDFPRNKPQSSNVKKQNEMLKDKFLPELITPTTVILDADGKPLGGFSGYLPGGPKAFIAKVEEIEKKPAGKIEE